VVDDELLLLSQQWPVSTIDGEPFLTRGSLAVIKQPGSGVLLTVSSGDETHPNNIEVQFPLSNAQAALLVRALGGEQVGQFNEDA
jgi:hypothetical protein